MLSFLSLFLLGTAEYLMSSPGAGQYFSDGEKLPKSFRLSRSKSNLYVPLKVLHNPSEDIYVVFLVEQDIKAQEIFIYSRAYNYKGKPKGPFYKLLPLTYRAFGDNAVTKYFITGADVCYNSTDNKFFIIWNYQDSDGIYGAELNERGNREGVTTYSYQMKKRLNKYGTGWVARIVWMAGKNQYAMGWTYIDASINNPNNPKNGYYLATFTPFLTPKKAMKKVKSMRVLGGHYYPFLTAFFAAGDNLFWSALEPLDDTWSNPAVWLTKSNGKNLSPAVLPDTGVKYPGKKFISGTGTKAAYAADDGIYLLTWNSADDLNDVKKTYQQNHYRLMDKKGNFISKEQILNQVENFQSAAAVSYDEADGHFFLVCAEYKVLDELNFTAPSAAILKDEKANWGGRLWGYKIDKQGNQIGSRIPLTKVFSDVNSGLMFRDICYNASDDQHFVYYYVVDYNTFKSKAFGLIYK